MNKNMVKKTGLFLLFSTCLISACESDKPIQGLQKLVNQRAEMAIGVNFDTTKLVVLDPYTGKEVLPCIQTVGAKQDYQSVEEKKHIEASDMKIGMQKCNTELNVTDTNLALISALELSKKPIKGEIKKNGEIISARFVVTVSALYLGSDCNNAYSGGNQYENCGQHR